MFYNDNASQWWCITAMHHDTDLNIFNHKNIDLSINVKTEQIIPVATRFNNKRGGLCRL